MWVWAEIELKGPTVCVCVFVGSQRVPHTWGRVDNDSTELHPEHLPIMLKTLKAWDSFTSPLSSPRHTYVLSSSWAL